MFSRKFPKTTSYISLAENHLRTPSWFREMSPVPYWQMGKTEWGRDWYLGYWHSFLLFFIPASSLLFDLGDFLPRFFIEDFISLQCPRIHLLNFLPISHTPELPVSGTPPDPPRAIDPQFLSQTSHQRLRGAYQNLIPRVCNMCY